MKTLLLNRDAFVYKKEAFVALTDLQETFCFLTNLFLSEIDQVR